MCVFGRDRKDHIKNCKLLVAWLLAVISIALVLSTEERSIDHGQRGEGVECDQ